MFRLLPQRLGAGQHRQRIDEIGWRIGCTAHFAGVAILILALAAWAGTADESVGQEHFFRFVIGLLDGLGVDMATFAQSLIYSAHKQFVFIGVRRMEIIESDVKCFQVFVLFGGDPFDKLLGRNPLLPRRDHDRRAVCVCGADINAIMAAHLLESRPNVRLHVFDHMSHMEGAIGIRKGAADENITYCCAHTGQT